MEDTRSLKLAKKYLSLGGTRKSKIDDNITDTRKWESEPQEAAKFWKENIVALNDDERKQVENSHRRSMMNDEDRLIGNRPRGLGPSSV